MNPGRQESYSLATEDRAFPFSKFWAWHMSGFNQAVLLPITVFLALASPGISLLLQAAEISPVKPDSPQTLAQVPSGATVLYVNPVAGTDATTAGSTTAPYRTITYALQQVRPGSVTVIQLQPGTYTQETGETFPLVLPAGTILRGNEADKGSTTSVIGGGPFISPTFARQSAAIVAGKSTEVRGLTVTNPLTRGTGVWIETSNPTVENNTFTRNNREGVFVSGVAEPLIFNNVFVENGGNGISVANKAKGQIRSNVFQNTGFGLAIGGAAAPLVSGNQVTKNVDGFYINDGAAPILRNNVIEENTRDGIVVTIAAKPNLGDNSQAGNNVIRNNQRFDLNNATKGPVYLVGNTIDEKKIAGLFEFAPPPIAGQPSIFPDVTGHWAQPFIEAMAKAEIISGFPGGVFRPNDPVTRVQFAAIINKAFNPPAVKPGKEFSDINTSFWGYQAIQTAVRGGFMQGYPEGDFRPAEPIPRAQVLVALGAGLSYPDGNLASLNRFQDARQIPSWATGRVAAATDRSVVVNYPSLALLNPTRPATRGEVAAIVYQAMVDAGKAPPIESPYIVLGNQ